MSGEILGLPTTPLSHSIPIPNFHLRWSWFHLKNHVHGLIWKFCSFAAWHYWMIWTPNICFAGEQLIQRSTIKLSRYFTKKKREKYNFLGENKHNKTFKQLISNTIRMPEKHYFSPYILVFSDSMDSESNRPADKNSFCGLKSFAKLSQYLDMRRRSVAKKEDAFITYWGLSSPCKFTNSLIWDWNCQSESRAAVDRWVGGDQDHRPRSSFPHRPP